MTRCSNKNCNKKVKGMIIMECKCGAKFCNLNHMIPYTEHDCTFNFSNESKIKLTNSLTADYTDNKTKLNRI